MTASQWMRQWMLWQLPPRAWRYVLTLDAAAVGVLVALVATTSWRVHDALSAAVFLACSIFSIEIFHRNGAPHRRINRPYHDLIGVFLFPAALVLPPVYAAGMPLALHALLQARVTRLPPVKRVFNTAATVLYCAGTALAHNAFARPLAHDHLNRPFATPHAIAGLFVAALVYITLNKALVVGIIRRVSPAAIVIVDLDHFKTINDRYGHLIADTELAAVADTLTVVVRASDLVGRFGGDEFTVLLNDTNETQATATAERLRHRLSTAMNHSLPYDNPVAPATASLGVAAFGHSGIDLDQLLAAADCALYQAKTAGRNRVRLAERTIPLPTPHPAQLL